MTTNEEATWLRLCSTNVDKVYEGGVHAVQGLTLDIEDGEFLVLVGPSGCGKTTALRMLAGLEEISAATISIGDRVVNDAPRRSATSRWCSRTTRSTRTSRVAENIAFGLRLRKMPKEEIDQRVEWAAKLLDLTPYLKRKPKELSGGQRQRVAMGRAIVREPQVFLMDEPLSNLDARLRVQMRAEIAKLQRELATTTIYVTHDQVEAMTMGDRVAVMSMGRAPAGRPAAAPLRRAGEPLRRRLHRHAADEPARGHASRANGTAITCVGGVEDRRTPAALARVPGPRAAQAGRSSSGVRPEDVHPAALRPELPHARRAPRADRGARHRGDGVLLDRRGRRSRAGRPPTRTSSRRPARGVGGLEGEPRRPLPAARPAAPRREIPVALDTAKMHFFDARPVTPLR